MSETYVGNDIVDLWADRAADRLRQPRWLERVLLPSEREQLAAHDEPELCLWQMWAAKEAAYKVFAKLELGIRFAPRRFCVDLEDCAVRCGAQRFSCQLGQGDGWVHALCWSHGAPAIDWGVQSLAPAEQGKPAAESAAARLAAARAAELNFGPGWQVVTDGWGRPQLLHGSGERHDLSLSHHGRFTAWAFPSGG